MRTPNPAPPATPAAPLPTFRIEKGVPVPTRGVRTSYLFPFEDMEIGDSIAVPAEFAKKARGAACSFAKREGIRLTCRTQADGSVRIWRVKK